jgi:hypothetical protein
MRYGALVNDWLFDRRVTILVVLIAAVLEAPDPSLNRALHESVPDSQKAKNN